MENKEENATNKEDTQKIVDGVVDIYQKPLVKLSENMKELLERQDELINTLNEKNKPLQASNGNDEMKKMFSDIALCKEKLVMIKKQMFSLHDRANKLKGRSQNVLTHATNQKTIRLLKLEQEQKLIGGQNSS